jgi:hypothetical protein
LQEVIDFARISLYLLPLDVRLSRGTLDLLSSVFECIETITQFFGLRNDYLLLLFDDYPVALEQLDVIRRCDVEDALELQLHL